MQEKLSPAEFLRLAKHIPVVDVRSPKEYDQGHIPGAYSIPLFTDEERAIVGTTYTTTGNQKAISTGLAIVGPKLQDYVAEARKIAANGKILVHCWRGGMRSEAMAWLFSFSGIDTNVLEGGYKAYRKHIRESFHHGPDLKVLGGMTGSGKTELLQKLKESGEQVIDLERLANHKGSAFGSLGQGEQPTNEQFENELAKDWMALDAEKPVWVEDESLNIGKVILPDALYNKMREARLVFVDVPFELRVERLVRDYGQFDDKDLIPVIQHISKRMGGDVTKKAIDAMAKKDVKQAIEIVLAYYDRTYLYSISKRNENSIIKIPISDFTFTSNVH